jgi:hypothetical protein
MGKTRKHQKGGVISIDDNILETFQNFIFGSTIDYLSVGTTGLVFTCENTDTSDYYAFRPNNLAKKITKIILKLCIVHDQTPLRSNIDGVEFKSIHYNDFIYEINNQHKIVNATCAYFEPSMPTILFTTITDEFNIEDVIAQPNAETLDVLQEFKSALLSFSGLKLGIIAMEHAGINETFQTIFTLMNSGIDSTTQKQADALAIYELIVLGVAGFYHGDHHNGNLLYTDNSTTDYFLSDDGSQKWYTGKRVLLIDAGRVSILDRTFESGNTEHAVFNSLVKKFRITGNRSYLQKIIQMIMDGGFNYDHNQMLKNHEVYAWFNKTGDELIEIAGYVHELMLARIESVKHVVERTRATVSDTFGGTADMNIIKQFISAELKKQRDLEVSRQLEVRRQQEISKQLTSRVIQHIKEQLPRVITERVARLQQELQEELEQGEQLEWLEPDKGGTKRSDRKRSDSKRSDRKRSDRKRSDSKRNRSHRRKMVGGENDIFLKFIEPIDLNELVQISCFAIVFATYLTGKFNQVEPSFMTLTMSFEQEQKHSFATEKQEHLFEKMPPFVSVSAGAGGKRKKTNNRKTRRKQKNWRF